MEKDIDLTSQIQRLKHEEDLYESLIRQLLTNEKSSNARKKNTELQDLAALIVAMSYSDIAKPDEVKIIEVREEPDFIIQINGKTIGIELTKLHTGDAQKEGSHKDLLSKSAALFGNKYPEIKLLANIELSDDLIVAKEKSQQLHEEISEIVHTIFNGNQPSLPNYMLRVHTMPHSGVDFELMGAGWVLNLHTSLVNRAVRNKESKIQKYRDNTNAQEIWLVPFVSGASPESWYDEVVHDDELVESSFNHIYFLNVFKKEIIKFK